MIQAKLISAFEAAPDQSLVRHLGLEEDTAYSGADLQVQCVECGTISWHHLDHLPLDVRDISCAARRVTNPR